MKRILLTTASALIAVAIANAAWEEIDTFESYADDAAMLANWTVQDDPDGEGGGISLIADPADPANKVMEHAQGVNTAESGNYNTRAYRGFPGVASGVATLYLRFNVPNVTIDGVALSGVVDEVWGITPDGEPTAYNQYSMLSRIEFDGSFDVYDSATYTLISETIPGNIWYEFWYVFDHDTRTFDAYIKGGDAYPEQFKVNAVPMGYRNATVEPLTQLVLTSSAGTMLDPKGLDAALFDDFYLDSSGENLASPVDGGTGTGGSGTKLINISTRGEVGVGDKVLIAGFVLQGEEPQQVLVRASGDKLGQLGVQGTLVNTVLEITKPGANPGDPAEVVATNTKWGDADNAADIATAIDIVGAFAFDVGSNDSAILMMLDPGVSYSAKVSGVDDATGVVIVEAYAVP